MKRVIKATTAIKAADQRISTDLFPSEFYEQVSQTEALKAAHISRNSFLECVEDSTGGRMNAADRAYSTHKAWLRIKPEFAHEVPEVCRAFEVVDSPEFGDNAWFGFYPGFSAGFGRRYIREISKEVEDAVDRLNRMLKSGWEPQETDDETPEEFRQRFIDTILQYFDEVDEDVIRQDWGDADVKTAKWETRSLKGNKNRDHIAWLYIKPQYANKLPEELHALQLTGSKRFDRFPVHLDHPHYDGDNTSGVIRGLNLTTEVLDDLGIDIRYHGEKLSDYYR